uniref:NADH-ubiquinone oxidoreductase chain 6 n=1 Tax=Extatosoma tiaratum TaxID=7024 RepID=I0J077_EXTTI|nr:NADH dehydrogenase subunit 6 [Extatosoma tiaratum]BAM10926.1 NADH dehydrogenase subunit 6 [Extatosoma tiaratum]
MNMNMMLNMMFLLMKHPLSMGMFIIMQTITISMMTGMMYKSFWFSYILFLMYVGGMMILFIYMTSLMPNKMFSMSTKKTAMIMIMTLLLTTIIIKNHNIMNNDMMKMSTMKMMLMKMYNLSNNISMIMLVMYLLFTMITIFNLMESNKSPLRMTY